MSSLEQRDIEVPGWVKALLRFPSRAINADTIFLVSPPKECSLEYRGGRRVYPMVLYARFGRGGTFWLRGAYDRELNIAMVSRARIASERAGLDFDPWKESENGECKDESNDAADATPRATIRGRKKGGAGKRAGAVSGAGKRARGN